MYRIQKILRTLFFEECNPRKKGRPMSVNKAESAERLGIDVCSQKRKKDGETVYYKTSNQRDKEKKQKTERQENRKKLGISIRGRMPKQQNKTGKNINPGEVGEVSLESLRVDPKRFQYKILGEKTMTGEVGSLQDVRKFDPNLAGLILAWKDPKTREIFIVNGHNRFALAKKSGVSNVAVRLLQAGDDREARAIGALVNIAEGRGSAIDAAKFFRDSGITAEDLRQKGIPFKESHAAQGVALASLEKMLFGMVVDGEIPIDWGVSIGGSGLSENQQHKLFETIKGQEKRGRNITPELLKEFVQFVKSAETKTKKTEDLFGEFEEEEDNIFDKLSVQSAISRKLSRETKVFGMVGKTKAANELAKAGNIINVESSLDRARQAKSAAQLFDALKNTKGPIANLLNSAANRIKAAGTKQQKEKIQDEIYEKILAELPKQAGI
jgi:hypothetical protein